MSGRLSIVGTGIRDAKPEKRARKGARGDREQNDVLL